MFLPSNITLQFGDSGDFVTELQRRLSVVKCFSEDMINGFYDGNTVGGVTHFQVMVGLHADGVAGPETLRRLNGVIAGGGTASGDGKKEEEKNPTTTQQHINAVFAPGEQINPASWGFNPQQPAAPVQTASPDLPPATLTANTLSQVSAEQAREADRAAAAAQQQQNQAVGLAIAVAARAEAPPLELAAEKQAADQPHHTRELAKEQAQAPRGMVGRLTQFANAVVQRLSDYFEKKLPPDVLNEVRQIGTAMAATGMKQTDIPRGAEIPAPAPTPGRGATPEQTQRV